MTLHNQLAAFDRLRGRDPVDGTHIQGFGPGENPPPDFPPGFGGATGQPEDPFGINDPPSLPPSPPTIRRSPTDVRGPGDPGEEMDPESLPLAAQAGAQGPSQRSEPPPPAFHILLDDSDDGFSAAFHHGRMVDLTALERARIRQTVLTGIARAIRAELDAVAALLPKRKRRATQKPDAIDLKGKPVRVRRKTVLHP